MLNANEIAALVEGHHPDPVRALGLHRDALGALWSRAFLPGAARVELWDASLNRVVANLQPRHAEGFFESALDSELAVSKHLNYRFRVQWVSGETGIYADSSSFAPAISDIDLAAFSAGTHIRPFEFLGAHPEPRSLGNSIVDGVRFSVWSPNASRVSVVGDFNAWDGRRHRLLSRGASGVWELFVPHAAIGDCYKFEVVNRQSGVATLKADPYARSAQYRPDTASIVAGLPPKISLPTDRAAANARGAPIAIYELHAGSWRKHPDGRFYTWDELAESLPKYAAELGFSHIELLPVSEHPFDGSWGYQTLGMYAPSARFGAPEGLRRFVQACHALGVGVLLDWVPAHFPNDTHGLAQFDGTALYEYADPREGFHQDWGTLIYNFGRHEVRSFLTGSALYWLERFGIDGVRVDAVASMLYRDYSRGDGQWVPNVHGGRENYEAISLFKHINEVLGHQCVGAITVAEESTTFPGVSAPTYAGGLGFHFKWNMGWMNDTLRYMQEDPIHRRWHHAKMTFGLEYAFSENFVLPLSHDEVVHGKRSLWGRMPGDDWQRFANLRAYFGFMWAHPGKKLLFMGQEFGQRSEWNHDVELPWPLLNDERHAGVSRLIRALNGVYRSHPALHLLDCDSSGFEWIDAHDEDHSIFSWLRRDDSGNVVIAVCNFSPEPHHHFRIGVPNGIDGWQEVINTDKVEYGGSGVCNAGSITTTRIAANGRDHSIEISVPPLATTFFAPLK
jgi:1,4-alpha-glucan branching enzyme